MASGEIFSVIRTESTQPEIGPCGPAVTRARAHEQRRGVVHSTGQAREHTLEVTHRRVERVHSMDQADGGGKTGHVRAFEEALGRVLFCPERPFSS